MSRKSIIKRNPSLPTTDTNKDQSRHTHKRLWLAVAGIGLLIMAITLAAILGDYFTRRHRPTPADMQTSDSPTPTPTVSVGGGEDTPQPTPTPTPTPTLIPPQIASVSVTGWNVPGPEAYNLVWLFWQDAEGYLTRAIFNSSTDDWSRVINFVKAKKGSPLAAQAFKGDWYADLDV